VGTLLTTRPVTEGVVGLVLGVEVGLGGFGVGLGTTVGVVPDVVDGDGATGGVDAVGRGVEVEGAVTEDVVGALVGAVVGDSGLAPPPHPASVTAASAATRTSGYLMPRWSPCPSGDARVERPGTATTPTLYGVGRSLSRKMVARIWSIV
jgi:hypothetical protein